MHIHTHGTLAGSQLLGTRVLIPLDIDSTADVRTNMIPTYMSLYEIHGSTCPIQNTARITAHIQNTEITKHLHV